MSLTNEELKRIGKHWDKLGLDPMSRKRKRLKRANTFRRNNWVKELRWKARANRHSDPVYNQICGLFEKPAYRTARYNALLIPENRLSTLMKRLLR